MSLSGSIGQPLMPTNTSASGNDMADINAKPLTDTLDEPVMDTIMRDLKSISDKLKMVLVPRKDSKNILRDWDLWGPLLLCLGLSLRLSLTAPESQVATVFTSIFVIIWGGAAIVTLNTKLLGGKLSIFQTICVLGYCIFPLVLASIVCLLVSSIIARALIVAASFGWSIVASMGFLNDVNLGNRKALAVYPMCLFYFIIGWMILISRSIFELGALAMGTFLTEVVDSNTWCDQDMRSTSIRFLVDSGAASTIEQARKAAPRSPAFPASVDRSDSPPHFTRFHVPCQDPDLIQIDDVIVEYEDIHETCLTDLDTEPLDPGNETKPSTSNHSASPLPNSSLRLTRSKKPSNARVRWKDDLDGDGSMMTPRPDMDNESCTASSTSTINSHIASLGSPLVTWSPGSAPFGRLRFETVSFTLSAKQSAKLNSTGSASGTVINSTSNAANGLKQTEMQMRLSYKVSAGLDAGILRATLANGGFTESGPTQSDWNLFWSNGKIEPHEFRSFNKYQKINRFPKMSEMCRKDKLYMNISRLKQVHGDRHFDYFPPTFLLPQEYDIFYTAYLRAGGRWIIKPINSVLIKASQIIDSLAELPTHLRADDRFLVQKYIENPLKVNGCRFDLRVYVTVTSFSPLRIYMFQEGTTKVVKMGSQSQDTFANKGTLSSLIRHISNSQGATASALLLSKIKDIIIKTFLAGESIISNAATMFVQHPGNCFELLAFDILIDAGLNPWLMDVVMSPSLSCEHPVDLEVKAPLMADLLTMLGMIPFQKHHKKISSQQVKPCRPPRGETTATVSKTEWSTSAFWENDKLTPEQQKLARIAKEENGRSNGFERIFPTESTAYIYNALIQKSSINWSLHVALFGKQTVVSKPKSNINHSPHYKSGDEDAFEAYSHSHNTMTAAWRVKQSVKESADLSKRKGTEAKKVSSAPWIVPIEEEQRAAKKEEEPPVPGVPHAAEPTEVLLKKVSIHLNDIRVSKEGSEAVGAKLQAREAFQVFLESILDRLNSHSRSSLRADDQEYVQQQVQILERFLQQANDLHVGDDGDSDLDLTEPIGSIQLLAVKLEAFLRKYKRQTESFKKTHLSKGRLVQAANTWVSTTSVPSSSDSSRQSSNRPLAASLVYRPPETSVPSPMPSNAAREASIESNSVAPFAPIPEPTARKLKTGGKASTSPSPRPSALSISAARKKSDAILLRHVQRHFAGVGGNSATAPEGSGIVSAFPSYSWSPSLLAPASKSVQPKPAKYGAYRVAAAKANPSFDFTVQGEKLRRK
ncbi:Tubulin polyglutamylase ttll5 [Chytriomyces hyalinus]|nr:Tubulin polyglutamylase ttll5 [Chytriomyces hyalinus]